MSTPTLFDVQPLDEVSELLAEVGNRLDMLVHEATPSFERQYFPMVPVPEYGRLILLTREIRGQAEEIAEYAARIALVDADREGDLAA